MNYFFTTATFFIVISLNAQQKETIEQYCTMKTFGAGFLTETTIEIDYGQEGSYGFFNRVKDSITGKSLKFKSPVDALNYMGKQGWKLINAVSNSTDNSSYVYIFKKEVLKTEWY